MLQFTSYVACRRCRYILTHIQLMCGLPQTSSVFVLLPTSISSVNHTKSIVLLIFICYCSSFNMDPMADFFSIGTSSYRNFGNRFVLVRV